MVDAGLALMPIRVDRLESADVGKMERVVLLVTYRLLHESGEHVDIQTMGSADLGGGKAAYAAQTGALKYAVRQLFAIPTGDDPDADERAPARPANSPPRPAPPAGPPPSPSLDQGAWLSGDEEPFRKVLANMNLALEDLVRFRAAHGKGHPKDLSNEDLQKLGTWLALSGGIDKVREWLKSPAAKAA
jgi:hypothetical protein